MTILRIASLTLLVLSAVALVCAPVQVAQVQAQAQPEIREIHPTFTLIEVPGAKYTGAWGINSNGDIVGNYGQDTNSDSHGFLYRGGAFTFFDYPGQSRTLPTGINDSGLIVGEAGDPIVVGFVYDGLTFTTIRHGTDSATSAIGINNAGDIVGGTGTVFATKGFAIRDGNFKRLHVPGQYIYVYGTGINNRGQIAGWTDEGAFKCHGGTCQTFQVPGATTTEALGINDDGVIVGWYDKAPFSYAFVLRNGKYLSFRYPGALATAAAGINNSGQIVGEFTSDFQAWHGFVTSPIMSADFQ
jgi:uncharacterized membrane protein